MMKFQEPPIRATASATRSPRRAASLCGLVVSRATVLRSMALCSTRLSPSVKASALRDSQRLASSAMVLCCMGSSRLCLHALVEP